jgi:hypothetical protein
VGHGVAALHGAPCHLIAELEWDMMDELRAFASPQGRVTAADAARLQEIAQVRRMIFTADETVMLRPVQVGSSAATRLSDSHRLKSAVLQLR